MISKKSHKYILSFIIITITYGYIYHKLSNFDYLNSIIENIFHKSSAKTLLLFLVIFLMIINWSIEAIKWKYLLQKIQNISFVKSLKGVFAGVTIGIFTPNRVGELGGRIVVLEKQNRKKSIIATALGSYSQFITSLIFGIISLTYFFFKYSELAVNKNINIIYLIVLSCFLLFIGFYEYLTFKISEILISKIKFLNRYENTLFYLKSKTKKELLLIISLSILRYFIFIYQFYLLLIFFDVHISFINAFITISITYLTMTIIPTTTLSELGIRGSIAILFIGIFTSNTLGIIMASIMVWIINIAVPAIIGSINYFKLGKL